MADVHTGYLLKFGVCTGTDRNRPPSGDKLTYDVFSLLKSYENKGCIIFTDFYFGAFLLDAFAQEKKEL